MSLYVGERQVCAGLDGNIQTCTLDGHLHRVTYTRYRIKHSVRSREVKTIIS